MSFLAEYSHKAVTVLYSSDCLAKAGEVKEKTRKTKAAKQKKQLLVFTELLFKLNLSFTMIHLFEWLVN